MANKFKIVVELVGFGSDNLFTFFFETPRELAQYLRKLPKMKRVQIERIISIEVL